MPTVSGVWKWNDKPVVNKAIDRVPITFTCNNTSYTSISISNTTSGPGNICYGPGNSVVYGFDLGDTWRDEAYRTMDFGSSPQEVSQDFYNYLTANATKQEEPVVPTTTKTVSSDNLARFKQKCDETYAAIGNIPTVSTELVNLGTLSTSGTLTADQVTQIGTTTIGVTVRASVNGVTRFYERVNISGTTATLVSADDDALHVLTVNLSTRAYTLSDVALGGGGGGALYRHNLLISKQSSTSDPVYVYVVVYSTSDSPITSTSALKDAIGGGMTSCSGYASIEGALHCVFNVYVSSGVTVSYINASGSVATYNISSFMVSITDNVVQA